MDIAAGHGQSACRRSFADLGKNHMIEILGIPAEEFEQFKLGGHFSFDYQDPTTTKPRRIGKQHDSGRDFVIRYFESAKLLFGDDFWTQQLLPLDSWRGKPVWHRRFNHADLCIVSDLRFEVEAQRVRELDGEIWIIERTFHEKLDAPDEHGFRLDGHEKRINNNGSLDDLRRNLEIAL